MNRQSYRDRTNAAQAAVTALQSESTLLSNSTLGMLILVVMVIIVLLLTGGSGGGWLAGGV